METSKAGPGKVLWNNFLKKVATRFNKRPVRILNPSHSVSGSQRCK